MTEPAKRGLFYSRSYICVFCGEQFEGWRMYPTARNAHERWDEYFDFPYYDLTDASGRFANYLAVEVKVCPACAFASNDDNYFLTERTTEGSWEPDPLEKEAIRAQSDARMQLASGAANLQAFPRDLNDALVAFKVAMHSSTILLNAHRRNSVEAARLGNYALKCAFLSDKIGQPERVQAWRKAAYEYFSRGYELDLKGLVLYRTIYQLGALAIYFGEDRTASKAHEFLKALSEREPVRDLHRYLQRLKKVWTDRDMYRMKA